MIRLLLTLLITLCATLAHAHDDCEGRAIEYIDREGYEWCLVEPTDPATVEVRFTVVDTPEELFKACWRYTLTFSACGWGMGSNSVCRVYILAGYESALTRWHETQHCYGYRHRKRSPLHLSHGGRR